MKHLIVALVLFAAAPAFADSFKAGIEELTFNTANNSAAATIYIHGVSDGHPNHKFFFANATNVDVLSLTCAKACAGFNATVAISGLTMNNVLLADGQFYSKLYVAGTLTLSVKFVPSLPYELGQITGTFQACINPPCSGVVFSFFTNTTTKTFLNVVNNGGKLTLVSGLSTVPEPTTVALLGTGCLFLIGLAWEQCKRKLCPHDSTRAENG